MQAATAAARMAVRTGEPLHLLHALDVPKEDMYTEPKSALLSWGEQRVLREAARLRELGAEVRTVVTAGRAEEALQTAARELGARLIIIGARGQRGPLGRSPGSELGSHADRTAQRSMVPVLIVRESAPFEAWLRGERPLRVVLGVDASRSSEHAARWVGELCDVARCEVVLAHLYWPPGEFHRIGLGGLRSYVDPDAEILRTLQDEYGARFGGLFGSTQPRYRIEPHLGRVGDGLASLASEENADLLVVGCHDHSTLSLLWEGSVARHALRCAHSAVACVPAPAQASALRTPILDDVLAATDFSPSGAAGVALAYGIVSHGGTVHLVHVVKSAHTTTEPYDIFTPPTGGAFADAEASARSRLLDAVPRDAGSAAALTRVHVLFADNPARAICQAAERLGADVICVGTHGRTGLRKAILGSVAQAVVEHTERPVLLARAPQT